MIYFNIAVNIFYYPVEDRVYLNSKAQNFLRQNCFIICIAIEFMKSSPPGSTTDTCIKQNGEEASR